MDGEKMGWSNYIVIDDLKVSIETNREVDEIEFYREEALDKLIDVPEDIDIDVDMENVKISELTVGNLSSLYQAYKTMCNLYGTHVDKFLLYWLKSKNIKFNIISEYNFDIKKYEEDGFKVLRRY